MSEAHEQDTPPEQYLRPSEAAERLGISPAMVRRHAKSYEEIFGSLGVDWRDGRIYTETDVQRLEAALAEYHAGNASSVAAALEAIRDGETNPGEVLAREAAPDPLTQILGELTQLRTLVEMQARALAEHSKRLEALPAPEEREEVEDLRRRVRYLQGELERRDNEEGPQESRPWWKLWG